MAINNTLPDVVRQRPLPSDLEKTLDNPGQPRVSIAASKEKPDGTSSKNIPPRTVLQQHVDFFDKNGDGVITPYGTFLGFRELGFNLIFSLVAVAIIHGALAYPTQDSFIPSPFFKIYTKNIHKSKHGSDQEVYDTEGRFVPQKFEEMFSKYDLNRRNALNFWEMTDMLKGARNAGDPFGWSAAFFEWGALYLLVQTDGLIHKEQIRKMYDGSLFYDIAQQRREAKSGSERKYQ
ncbi:Caleosin-domain-containing protein [Basidiobolus meristosporus CBS 931.73]|uniref:Caleosin-domain-containing protein n=1 Tax=Basidiobolus meristosporus CBS 931.73 TaxID=1314790 RepID=A0A1Y1Y987_9FUNG|nr:Caleosin-domain-containing protein [Basidiobolus meristosporus CBS 931.73]|eukprot:ORX94579.1 Caleosin-domain-containing protein [Basidiobolus meristosporus CBS 931.73]